MREAASRHVARCPRTTRNPIMNLVGAPGNCPLTELQRHREGSHLHLAIDTRLAQQSEPPNLSAEEDSGFHLQPRSQLRIRMMPANRPEVQEALAQIAFDTRTIGTLTAANRIDYGLVVDPVGHFDRFACNQAQAVVAQPGPGPACRLAVALTRCPDLQLHDSQWKQ